MRLSGKPACPPNWLKVFGLPLLIAAASATGLLAALTLGEPARYFAWLAVGSPVITVAWLKLRGGAR